MFASFDILGSGTQLLKSIVMDQNNRTFIWQKPRLLGLSVILPTASIRLTLSLRDPCSDIYIINNFQTLNTNQSNSVCGLVVKSILAISEYPQQFGLAPDSISGERNSIFAILIYF